MNRYSSLVHEINQAPQEPQQSEEMSTATCARSGAPGFGNRKSLGRNVVAESSLLLRSESSAFVDVRSSSTAAQCPAPRLDASDSYRVLRTAYRTAYGAKESEQGPPGRVLSGDSDSNSECSKGDEQPAVHENWGDFLRVIDCFDGGTEITLEPMSLRDLSDAEHPIQEQLPSEVMAHSRNESSLFVDIHKEEEARASQSHCPTRVPSLHSFGCALNTSLQDAADCVKEITRDPSPDVPRSIETPSRNVEPSGQRTIDDVPSTTCGGCCKPEVDSAVLVEHQKSLERTIECLMSSSLGGWCDGWQAWSSFQHGPIEDHPTNPHDIRRVLRNRACDMNARSRRIERLRKDLAPFDLLLHEGPPVETKPKRTQSFHMVESLPVSPTTEISGSVVSLGSVFGSCGDSSILSDSPIMLRKKGVVEEEELCYDSDPGETIDRGPAANRTEVDVFLRYGAWSAKDHTAGDQKGPTRPTNLDLSDEAMVDYVIDETMHGTMTLVWHRCNEAGGKVYSPMSVKAWIEPGAQLRSTLIHPRLMWKPAHESEEDKATLGIMNPNLNGIDLLDITRVLAVTRIDRRKYPLAKVKGSLSIDTLSGSMLFETSCETERDRIVQGLKLVVARLGSKIIVGDDGVFEEFFSSFGGTAPGQGPSWA